MVTADANSVAKADEAVLRRTIKVAPDTCVKFAITVIYDVNEAMTDSNEAILHYTTDMKESRNEPNHTGSHHRTDTLRPESDHRLRRRLSRCYGKDLGTRRY